nr:tRNA (adenosine(37)-N6)-threonylcarbamoyltransferase complex dimerization subunit type 1 TsaB [Roseospira goensis]
MALESSGRACGVCVWRAGAVLARADHTRDHGHAELLAPLVRDTMATAGVSFDALSAIAVTVGPGSFTGLRVGLALARGLGLAAGCPVRGATTTAVLAAMARAAAPVATPVAVVLDARRADVYLHVFDAAGAPLDAPVSLAPADALAALPTEPLWLTGDGVALLPRPLPPTATVAPDADRAPDPAVLAALVAHDPTAALPPRPLYVRPPDAALPPPNARARA